MRTIYREKKYYCGDYLEVYLYPVYRKAGPCRARRAKPTGEAQAALNRRGSRNRMIRQIHANFGTGDLALHLTYGGGGEPESDEQAKRDLTNFLRRVKRRRARLGLPELKYIAVTERGSRGRYHHHLILSGGLDRDDLERLWGRGYANSRRLQWDECGLIGLGTYIAKAPVGGKLYNSSRNLVKPEPRTRDGRITRGKAEELARDPTDRAAYGALYPGYFLAEAEPICNPVNGGVYLCVRMYRDRGKGGASDNKRVVKQGERVER